LIKEISSLFGLSFQTHKEGIISDKEIEALIEQRINYKSSKMFKQADEIRAALENRGIILEDTRDGKTSWRRKL